jgi:cyclophilin family peptidyl-prolyl cis-trans isomerase
VLTQIKTDYPDRVRVVYRHFPLVSIHDKALLSTQAAEAAGLQGKFWEMHNLLYASIGEWSSLTPEEFEGWLLEAAADLNLDVEQFEVDLTSDELAAQASAYWEDGQEIGLPGTPFFVVNNNPYNGPIDSASIETLIKLTDFSDRQYSECPPMLIDAGKSYTATIETEKGDIVLNLFPDVAPLAVNSFFFLAQEGWFDGVTFHRVLPGFMAQAGDPTGLGIGGPGYMFKNETSEDLVFDRAGLLAMANSGADTNGSQFFITYGPAEHLNGNFTIFGEVTKGMEVVESLTPRDPNQGTELPPGDAIISIKIKER